MLHRGCGQMYHRFRGNGELFSVEVINLIDILRSFDVAHHVLSH